MVVLVIVFVIFVRTSYVPKAATGSSTTKATTTTDNINLAMDVGGDGAADIKIDGITPEMLENNPDLVNAKIQEALVNGLDASGQAPETAVPPAADAEPDTIEL